MIRGFAAHYGQLRPVEDPLAQIDEVIWFDLYQPAEDEQASVGAALGLDIPTREDMQEIEISSRLYYTEGAAVMTANLPAGADADDLEMSPVTFILTGDKLVTIRYHDPRTFRIFPQQAAKISFGCTSGESVLITLLEAIVDRLADVLERGQREIDVISQEIFRLRGPKSRDLHEVLQDIGRKGDLTSNIRDSLVTMQRLTGFLGQVTTQRRSDKNIRGRVKTLSRDTHSLTDHSSFLSQKITFLLDATLGVINIEQNAIIKIFSVAAVVFLPPTLIASIYGMNFDHMPELDWPFGYPFAIGVMIASAILPYWFFKRRGWL
jgi:magnesium transporter